MPPLPEIEEKRRAAREVIDVLQEISLLLVCTRKTTLLHPFPRGPNDINIKSQSDRAEGPAD